MMDRHAQGSRLHAQGHFVVLVAGKNFLSDELFLFEAATDAQEFYDRGFMKWESFIGDDDEGCGFLLVSLYRDTGTSLPQSLVRRPGGSR